MHHLSQTLSQILGKLPPMSNTSDCCKEARVVALVIMSKQSQEVRVGVPYEPDPLLLAVALASSRQSQEHIECTSDCCEKKLV